MRQKCEDDFGLWILNEIIKKIYPENMKKIVGAIQPNPTQFEWKWAGLAVLFSR